jgi:hypothetical protein
VVRVVSNIPALPDQPSHAFGSPEGGGKTVGLGPSLQGVLQIGQLLLGKPGLATRTPRLLQGGATAVLPILVPAAGGLAMHAKSPRGLSGTEPLVKEPAGLQPALFELVEIAFDAFKITHAPKHTTRLAACHYILQTSITGFPPPDSEHRFRFPITTRDNAR